ncbi:MAG: hypothetical protein LBH41_00105 [Rickettsiales bacterium]|jgi:hypothetical protein|nr:hypothetical protein [Rickettsiales bacterium]
MNKTICLAAALAGAAVQAAYYQCAPCPKDHYCPNASAAPIACPDGKVTDSAGAQSEGDCKPAHNCPLNKVLTLSEASCIGEKALSNFDIILRWDHYAPNGHSVSSNIPGYSYAYNSSNCYSKNPCDAGCLEFWTANVKLGTLQPGIYRFDAYYHLSGSAFYVVFDRPVAYRIDPFTSLHIEYAKCGFDSNMQQIKIDLDNASFVSQNMNGIHVNGGIKVPGVSVESQNLDNGRDVWYIYKLKE